MPTKPLIFGLAGPALADEERSFFQAEQPWGFILFARNVENPEQVTRLCRDLRSCVDHDKVPILIDQEGGRVQRFKPPHWQAYPPASRLGNLYDRDLKAGLRATWLLSRLHAFDLLACGVNVDCLPVLDVPVEGAHNVIGDRAYGFEPAKIAELGRAACDGLLAGGVKPMIKHIPGHGRAMADSHHDLPVVDASLTELENSDFQPFVDLANIPMAMTAHVIYSAVDPDHPATTSKKVMDEIVRGYMDYQGLVVCDDITMNALSGDLSQRTRSIFDAGCDIVLHCTGKMNEMVEIAAVTGLLSGISAERAKTALLNIENADQAIEADCRAEFESLMGTGQIASADDPTRYGPTG